jgi:hypothetical protein
LSESTFRPPSLSPIMSLARLGALPINTPRSRLTFLLVPLLIFIFVSASQAYNRNLVGFVQNVSDGNTVTLVTLGGAKLRVRLYGIKRSRSRYRTGTSTSAWWGSSGQAIETSTRRWCGKGGPGRTELILRLQ